MDATVLVAAYRVEGGKVLEGRALAPRLLPYLAFKRLLDGLPNLDDSAGDAPLTLGGLITPLDEKNLPPPDDYSGDAGDGVGRVLPARVGSLRLPRRRPRSPSG